jgi:preprotein translocase subunit SecG
MVFVFLVLIVILSAALGFVVLVQNPKGGGLAESVGGIGNQFMGVKQTTDVLEKGTWIFAGAIAVLAIISTVFLKGGGTGGSLENSSIQKINTTTTPTQNQGPTKK